MRRFFFLLLALSIALPPSVPQAAPKPVQDCLICGHKCCCPEVCAPKLKQIKENASNVAVGCSTGFERCTLQSERHPTGLLNTKEHLVSADPQMRAMFSDDFHNATHSTRLKPADDFVVHSIALDIPTPPPKTLA